MGLVRDMVNLYKHGFKVALLASLSIGHCLASPSLQESKIEVQLVTQDFPPFSYQENGIAKGFAVELIQHNCDLLKWQCQIHFRPWPRALNELRAGHFHGAFLMGKNAAREHWLRFSQPVLTTEYGVFVQRSNPLFFRRGKDLGGYNVAVYGPSNTSLALKQLIKDDDTIHVSMRPDDIAGFRQLNAGWVDAVYSNKSVGQAIIHRFNLSLIRYAGADRTLNYYVAFSSTHTTEEFVDSFNTGLQQLISEGKRDQLMLQYEISNQP